MKRELKGFIVGVIITAILMSSVAFAAGARIDVVFNAVNISINGKKIAADNILYNGTTYVPLRAVADMFGKDVGWDQVTNTALINDKAKTNTVKVTRVVDGDTIEVALNGATEKVRLIGVDTPESVHPDKTKNTEFGKVASNFTKERLEGKDVELEFDVQERDQYGRLLAYVWLGGTMFNKTLLEEGYAQVATFPPNVKYVDEFVVIQRKAMEGKKGLWAYEEVAENPNNLVGPVGNAETANYVGSLSSDKYHKLSCTHAKTIKEVNIIYFESLKEAESKGYSPCGVCGK